MSRRSQTVFGNKGVKGVRVESRFQEISNRHPPRFTDGLVAAWHRYIAEMGHPAKASVIAQEELSAPDRSIHSVAGAVEDHANDLLIEAVFCHAACHVSVVVLNGKRFDLVTSRSLQGVPGAG